MRASTQRGLILFGFGNCFLVADGNAAQGAFVASDQRSAAQMDVLMQVRMQWQLWAEQLSSTKLGRRRLGLADAALAMPKCCESWTA